MASEWGIIQEEKQGVPSVIYMWRPLLSCVLVVTPSVYEIKDFCLDRKADSSYLYYMMSEVD